ncbi:MAG TPA: hypothetical protein VGM25_06535 [Caulobacteraceae bacterium]|jgi:hypothetical protein
MTAGPGFTVANWRQAPVFDGHCATPADVENAAAVFALADTLNGRPLSLQKPAPVIWYAQDEEFAALVVQAEAHESNEEEHLEVLGLLLPGGGTAMVFTNDVEFVPAADPVWRSLLQADGEAAVDDEDGAEWADYDLPEEPPVEVWREVELD